MNSNQNRRTFLRGLGISLALPTFESLGQSKPSAPLRAAFLYVPNGVNEAKWIPKGVGAGYELNQTQQPFANYKADFQILSGLGQRNTTPGPDGGGNHARAQATFLTCTRPRKTAGADIRLGVSIDQVLAKAIGSRTRFQSLELSCDHERRAGTCDSGYSCVYQYNMAWRDEHTPITPEVNPRHVFERLFGAGDAKERRQSYLQRMEKERSILDFVIAEARDLQRNLSGRDVQKLDEYLTTVRDLERRLDHVEKFGNPPDAPNGAKAPKGIPAKYEEHIRMMMDLIVLAFQTDSTRVATFCLSYDENQRSFPDLGINDGHHYLSHHGKDPEKLEKVAKIDLFYSRQLRYFLDRMTSQRDVDGNTLLHNSACVWASGLSDGDRHVPWDLPVILAGHGGGRFNPGYHHQLPKETPMANLYLSMLERFGVASKRFGDSTKALSQV